MLAKFANSSLIERVENALQCLAVADAVGYLYEFEENRPDRETILLDLKNENRISDDTQMTLFSFKAVYDVLNGEDPRKAFEQAYLWWYKTQISSAPPRPPRPGLNSFLELYHKAAPGQTCIGALRSLSYGNEVKNDSYGCGSVMRLMPLTLLFNVFGLDKTIEIAKISANVTHKHHLNDIAVEKLMRVYHDAMVTGSLSEVVVGEDFSGWDAISCVDAAIEANRQSRSFEDLVVWCIQNTEDCDSTAAVAASIWGLTHAKIEYKVKEQRVLDYTMLTFKEYLQEAKNIGVLYHFTKLDNLEHLASEKLQRNDLDADIFTLYAKRGASLTRNYALSNNPYGDFSKNNGFVVRLVIDGNKLSDKYKIRSVAGFSINQNDPTEVLNVSSSHHRLSRHEGEAEELVIPKNDLVELKNAILSVDFIADTKTEARINDIVSSLRSKGIKTSVYKNWVPYRKI